MSAAVNRGIIKFLNQQGLKDNWQSEVSKSFDLQFIDVETPNLRVEGELNSILDFEKYLDIFFPMSPLEAVAQMRRAATAIEGPESK